MRFIGFTCKALLIFTVQLLVFLFTFENEKTTQYFIPFHGAYTQGVYCTHKFKNMAHGHLINVYDAYDIITYGLVCFA